MVANITSRKAGSILARVIVLLFVPMTVLGYLYVRESNKAIRTLGQEIIGVKLIDAAMPHIHSDTAWQPVSITAELLKLERSIAPEIGGRGLASLAHDIHAAAHNESSAHDHQAEKEHVENVLHYIDVIAAKSQLKLDADGESYFVMEAATSNLPKFIAKYFDVMGTLERAVDEGNIDPRRIDQMLLSLGGAVEALDRLDASVATAIELSGDPEAHAEMSEQLKTARHEFGRLGSVMGQARTMTGDFALRTYLADEESQRRFLAAASIMWKAGSSRLSKLLNSRLDKAKSDFWMLFGLAVACGLVAIALAVRMFTTQLRKLDEVDRAREISEAARSDAERMAGELGRVNEDMAVLNRDLADNLTRLKDAQDELLKRGRMEQLGQLTATIAHELRNPLGAVRTSTFLLERKLKDKGLGLETQFERINKGVVRCDNIITQLLDFSRTKKLTPKPEYLDDWLAKAVEEAAQKIPASVQIECHLGLESQQVPFDGARLERAIINLLSNAAEAMVGLGDETNGFVPCIKVQTGRQAGYATITVSDNGPGMSPEVLAKVREPLFTTKSFGTGLGIPAIEQIAHQHDGKLEIVSAPGAGAKFTIYLPLSLHAAAA